MLRRAAPLFACLVFAAPAPAQVVTFTKIADTATTAPGGGTFTAFSFFPGMDGSTAAFQGTANSLQGIYAGAGGPLSTFVVQGSPIPNGTGNFTAVNGNFRYDTGGVVFVGSSTGPTQSGVYTSNGSTVARVADLNTAIPGGTGNFTSFSPFPSLSGGIVSFAGAGTAPTQSGVYSTATGSLAAVADLTTAAPGASGNFTGFGANPSVSGTTTVFRASSSLGANAGVYQRTGGGAVSVVADLNTPLPGGGGNFTGTFSEPTISGSNVSFIVNNGVYARIGGVLRTIANTATPSPNGTGLFTTITTYAPIDGTSVAFIGATATSRGIYLYTNGQLFTLIDNTSPTFDGKTLAASPFFLGPDAVSGNQVAFGVSFTSPSSSGIYVATFTPVPEPSALALAGVGMAGLAWRRARRRAR